MTLAAVGLVAASAMIHLVVGIRSLVGIEQSDVVGLLAGAFILWGLLLYGLVAVFISGVISPRTGAVLLVVAMLLSVVAYIDWHVFQLSDQMLTQLGVLETTGHNHHGHGHGEHTHGSAGTVLSEHLRADTVALVTKGIEVLAIGLFAISLLVGKDKRSSKTHDV